MLGSWPQWLLAQSETLGHSARQPPCLGFLVGFRWLGGGQVQTFLNPLGGYLLDVRGYYSSVFARGLELFLILVALTPTWSLREGIRDLFLLQRGRYVFL